MNDWKRTSRFLSDMAHKFGVGMATPDCQNGFGLVGDQAFVPVVQLDRSFTKLTPKGIRRWLWEVRTDPVWHKRNVLVYIERADPTGWNGKIGLVGDVAEENGIVFQESN